MCPFFFFFADAQTSPHNNLTLFKMAMKSYLQLPLILLCIGGGLRNGGGLVWAYNTKAYFRLYYCNTTDVGSFLSWVPLVGGSVGAVLGGVVSDRLARKRGYRARLWVLIGSQVCVRADMNIAHTV